MYEHIKDVDIYNAPDDYHYLMYITCKETDENVAEFYGDDKEELIQLFNDEFGDLYCSYEIFENHEDE